MTGLFLGIDLGTSGCRASVIDQQGDIVATHAMAMPAPNYSGRRVEQDPAIWWRAVLEQLKTLSEQGVTSSIKGIAIDGTSGTTLDCGLNGNPLSLALMYNDARADKEASRINSFAPAQTATMGPTSGLAKLLWLQGQGIESEGKHLYLSQADWVAGKLLGKFRFSDENNALKMGYDPTARRWPAWLDKLGIKDDCLPEVVPPGTYLGQITEPLARKYKLPRDCEIIAGTTDSIAGFIATGASKMGDAVTSLGSTLVIKVVAKQPVFAAKYGVYSHRLDNFWLVGGASNSGGAVLRKHFSQEQMNDMMPRLQPDQATGLNYYPLLSPGERFPFAEPDKKPVLEPQPPGALVFFQAILEGIANIETEGYRRLESLGAPYPRHVYTVGGGAHNEAWSTIRRQRLGVDISVSSHVEAAYGAAILARGGVMAPHPRESGIPE